MAASVEQEPVGGGKTFMVFKIQQPMDLGVVDVGKQRQYQRGQFTTATGRPLFVFT